MNNEPTSNLSVSKQDLEDPELFRLNQALLWVQSQINAIRNNAKLQGTTATDRITTQLYDQTPGPNDVVPWGTIKKYLSPGSIRQAFVTNNWLGSPVRPIAGIDIPANVGAIAQSIVDTHGNRPSYPASSYEPGSFYYETDRDSLYQVQVVSGTNTWVWVSGLMIAALASRPADLGTADDGFNFLSTTTDEKYSYRWNGAAWVEIDLFAENGVLATYSATLNSELKLVRARGTTAAPSSALANDVIANIIFQALRGGSITNAAAIKVEIESVPSGSTAAGIIKIQTSDSTGSALTTRWQFTADGNMVPAANNTYDAGSSTAAIKKTWTVGLNVKQGGAAGDVLTNDGSDNAVWLPPSAGAGSLKFARSSSFNALTTTFADVSGCSLSLDKNGTWLVTATFSFYKDINDDACTGQLLYDGSAQTGNARLVFKTADYILGTVSQQWSVSVTGSPKTAKLQAKKGTGTGASYSDFENTTIAAKFIG